MTSIELISPKVHQLLTRWGIDKEAKIADLGSGSDYFLNYLASKGFQNLWGCDLRAVDSDKFTAIKADLSVEKPLEPTFEVIDHLEDIYHFIRFTTSALKPGGYST